MIVCKQVLEMFKGKSEHHEATTKGTNHEQRMYARVRVAKIPAGEAPLWVRKAWVGLVLPCYPIMGCSCGPETEVLSGNTLQSRCGVDVPQKKALMILRYYSIPESRAEKATTWWLGHGFPRIGQYFHFASDEVKVVSGVTQQRIVVVDGDEEGLPYGARCIYCGKPLSLYHKQVKKVLKELAARGGKLVG